MKKPFFSFLLLLFNLSLSSQNPIINGSLSSCNVQEYSISNFSSENNYTWIVNGGYLINHTTNSATIYWNNTPSATLNVISTNHITGEEYTF